MSQQTQPERGTDKEGDGWASFSWPQRPTTHTRHQQQQQRHAHLDCFSGIAGDMLLAACIDVGGPTLLDYVSDTLRKGLPALADEFTISHQRVWRGVGQIAATHVTVTSVYGNQAVPVPQRTAAASHDHSHSHSHGDDDDDDAPQQQQDHSHEHSHGHSREQPATSTKVNDDATSTANSHSHSHHHHHHHHDGEDKNKSFHVHGPLRNLPQIRRILRQATAERYIPHWVRRVALAAFTLLAEAEAHVHGAASVEEVHFHEVGAVDSIVDTIGSLLALHALLGLGGNDDDDNNNNKNNNKNNISISCTALPLGCGTVRAAHGLLPVPAPAALYLVRGLPVCAGPPGVTGELITPTGVALVRALLQECNNSSATTTTTTSTTTDRPPRFTLRHVGIGAGTKDFAQHPNILRLLVGDLIPEQQQTK